MQKFILILDGPMGAGKSTVGALVHKKLKRTALVNIDKVKWFISDFKRGKKDNAITRKVVVSMCDMYLKQGISLIIPEGFTKSRVAIRPYSDLAKKYRAKLLVYHLDAPKSVLLKRIISRPIQKKARTPMTKARILRNIKIWKSTRATTGEFIQTHNTMKEKIAKKISERILSE